MAEANLFRIRGITGVADTEASNMQALGEEKGRGEERGEKSGRSAGNVLTGS